MNMNAYLGANDLLETVRKIMLQIATWDGSEGTWEVSLPPYRVVTEELANDLFEVQTQLDEVFEQNGITYDTVVEENGVVKVIGVRLG
jgi:hypothetical protein